MKYFTNCHTLDELKKEYRRLCMLHHPDRGGDLKTMQEINAEHDKVFETLKHQHNATSDAAHQTTETAAEFRRVVESLINLPGLEIELCGSWLWVGGNTYQNREALKAAGLRYSKGKKKWYWRHEEDMTRRSHRSMSMEYIRTKYGTETITSSRVEKLAAC